MLPGPLPPISPEHLTRATGPASSATARSRPRRGHPEASRALADGSRRPSPIALPARRSPPADALYEEFAPEPGFSQLSERNWIETGGGVLAADSPRLAFEMFDAFSRAGLTGDRRLSRRAGRRLGGEVHAAQGGSLIGGAWHQDGNFMGDVRALNVWLALSRCGEEAPGLDMVPRRVDYLVEAGTDGAPLSYVISPEKVEAAAGEAGIVRPIFEPGDVLLFDDPSCTRPARTPRCRTLATRSRAGSSARRASRPTTRRSRFENAGTGGVGDTLARVAAGRPPAGRRRCGLRLRDMLPSPGRRDRARGPGRARR